MAIIAETGFAELLQENAPLRCIEPHIYTLLEDGESTNAFDDLGSFYDRVICHPLYNRLMWGYSVKDYAILMDRALGAGGRWVLDAGCGSLAFSARAYLAHPERPAVLLDQSLTLLRIAKARLIGLNGGMPEHLVLLQGDALNLRFKPRVFDTLISLNLLHVINDAKKLLADFSAVVAAGGTMLFSTLVLRRRWADGYLNWLGKKGIGGLIPRRWEDLAEFFAAAGVPASCRITGNMAFITCPGD